MANLASNPWSVLPADVVVSTPTALTLNADGTVSLVTAAAHGLVTKDGATLIGNTPAAYNGFYDVVAAPTATTATLKSVNGIAAGTGVGTVFGTVGKCLYKAHIRIDDISWQNALAANHQLDLRDRNGNALWQATSVAAGSLNRGKLYWVLGLTPIRMDSGVVLMTIV